MAFRTSIFHPEIRSGFRHLRNRIRFRGGLLERIRNLGPYIRPEFRPWELTVQIHPSRTRSPATRWWHALRAPHIGASLGRCRHGMGHSCNRDRIPSLISDHLGANHWSVFSSESCLIKTNLTGMDRDQKMNRWIITNYQWSGIDQLPFRRFRGSFLIWTLITDQSE